MHGRTIYLDHNASAPLLPAAREAVLAALDSGPGNASSSHGAGQRLRQILETAREAVADVVGARPAEVIFTSGATEANALALRGILAADAAPRLVTSHAEHPSVLSLAARIATEPAADVALAPVDRWGRVAAADVCALVDDHTSLVSLVLAQPVTGALQPVAEVARALAGRAVLVHTDATQALGKIPLTRDSLGVDLLSISAHKIGGPQGIGALVVRSGTRFSNALWSGEQERGRRGGTEAVALAAGFAAAARAVAGAPTRAMTRATTGALNNSGERSFSEHASDVLAPLREYIRQTAGTEVWSPTSDALANTLLLAHADCPGDVVVAALDAEGIQVSTGTACASGARTPPAVLVAGGRSRSDAARAVRISVGAATTVSDVQVLCAALTHAVPRVRAALTRT